MRVAFAGSTRWLLAAVAALAFIAMGAAGAWMYLQRSMGGMRDMPGIAADTPAPTAAQAVMPPAGADDTPLPDVTIALTPEAVERAGIEVTLVRRREMGAGGLRLPGVVEANAYRQVVVTPLVAGRITSVSVVLGDRVSRGQPLAQVYSPELADAQTLYLTMRAELEAAHQQLRRTERLVEIGAASTQELERMRAEDTTHATDVESARAMLTLLGLESDQIARLRSAADITSTVSVPAPLAGVVTKRNANVGLNVDTSTELFTIVDLSSVWVIGELYERDFSRVTVGSPAIVTTAAYPGLAFPGKVSYIDPQVNPNTRTAKLRVEVGNPAQKLRLGMYADVSVTDAASTSGIAIPRTAVQSVGDRQVVYLVDPNEAGKFVEREVRLGEAGGEDVQVVVGLVAGDVVVAEGTFYLRAERERLGLRGGGGGGSHAQHGGVATPAVQTARVTLGDAGYEPATVSFKADVPAQVIFVRTSDKTCGTEIVFPSLDIRRALPLNEPVVVEFTPKRAGEIAFACGMGMLKGRIIVEASP
ncbi:MAG: efflux RND transporter periplasmic adaptor subunit [Vicinamibacteria bacterium]